MYTGANIIRDGLVLSLDAGSKNSYPGSGTTWYDLSGNSNHATATSPQYSGSDGGSFNFPNNTTSVFNTPSYTLVPNGGVTLETFVYPTTDTFSGGGRGITGRRNAYIYGIDTSFNQPRAEFIGNNSFSPPSVLTIPNIWYHILWTYSTTSIKTYVNGTNIYSVSSTYSIPTDTAAFQIGKRWGGFQEAFLGNISIIRWYNRPLSESEVQQNYNAQKTRFNII